MVVIIGNKSSRPYDIGLFTDLSISIARQFCCLNAVYYPEVYILSLKPRRTTVEFRIYRNMKVVVVPHDPNWKNAYEKEAELLYGALGPSAISIYHIGSTSVPGLAAKPIIDILIAARDIEEFDQLTDKFKELGYRAKGESGIPGRRFFVKDTNGERTHHIHAFQSGNSELVRHLNFCKFIRENPTTAEKYVELKMKLADRFPEDIFAYNDGKDAFIKEIDCKAAQYYANMK